MNPQLLALLAAAAWGIGGYFEKKGLHMGGLSSQMGATLRTAVALVGWAEFMIERVRRWQPENQIILTGDGGYAAVVLVQRCQRLKKPVCFISRLRLDAVLHDFPSPKPKGKRGPQSKKGALQPNLAHRLTDPATIWEKATIPWYGGYMKDIEFVSGVPLWYHRGLDPAPLRWVLGAHQITVSNPQPSSALIRKPRRFSSSNGSSRAGTTKSLLKNCVPISDLKPSVNGQTERLSALRPAYSEFSV